MTSELSMIHDRLQELIRTMTIQGAKVEHDGEVVSTEKCLEMARPLEKVMHEMRVMLCNKSRKQ